MNRTCIFIDLPNLIHTFTDLFASKYELQGNLKVLKAIDFKTLCLYLLPENSILTRAYIYSAKEFLFVPDREILDDFEKYKKFFLQKRKDAEIVRQIKKEIQSNGKSLILENLHKECKQKTENISEYFLALQKLKHKICTENSKIEFSKFGEIRYDIINCEYKSEKGVDVNLAVDMIRLSDIYDICILVSGDQDFIPAVQLIKDKGKNVYIPEFIMRNKTVVHAVSPKLKECVDGCIKIPFLSAEKFLRNPVLKKKK